MRILFVVPYPIGQAPSQRFRFEQYFQILSSQGITFHLQSFWDEKAWAILYRQGQAIAKVCGLTRGFIRRTTLLFRLHQYDFVFIHREASPIGPPVFEWLIARIFRKRIIYDFDDAIWLPNTSEVNGIVARLKWSGKVGKICQWAYKVSCGNAYLCNYARQYNKSVVLNPTTIDTEQLHNRTKQTEPVRIQKPVIGWTGTHSTLSYLNELLPVLRQLEQNIGFNFRVISNQFPDFTLQSLQFLPWKKDTEISDLLSFDIGVMPLTDDVWAQGKCGFKALQYMALGIPPLVSPVGVNTEIVENGRNGFICNKPEDWQKALIELLTNEALRDRMGAAARIKVEDCYSVRSNTTNFLQLFT
jgi:glycosyltransferase involved in cell wall biosynthesis